MMAAVKKVNLDESGLAVESGVMTVYNYDPASGLFMGASDEYLTQGVGIPANATSDAPPAGKSGKISIFSDGGWQLVADHRGETVYSTDTREAIEITLPGDYPKNTTPLKPATAFDVWTGSAWKTDLNAQRAAVESSARTEKTSRISEASDVTQVWQTQLMLGIITEADKAMLTKWMQYIQAVQAVDVSAAPDISWPVKPE